jgi:hypothetical protein
MHGKVPVNVYEKRISDRKYGQYLQQEMTTITQITSNKFINVSSGDAMR